MNLTFSGCLISSYTRCVDRSELPASWHFTAQYTLMSNSTVTVKEENHPNDWQVLNGLPQLLNDGLRSEMLLLHAWCAALTSPSCETKPNQINSMNIFSHVHAPNKTMKVQLAGKQSMSNWVCSRKEILTVSSLLNWSAKGASWISIAASMEIQARKQAPRRPGWTVFDRSDQTHQTY